MATALNLAGQRFGMLTAEVRLDLKEDRYYLWKCRCDCGNHIAVSSKKLKRGTITNCGCIPKNNGKRGSIPENLAGKRFGRLVADRQAPNHRGRTAWICQCDCGNSVTVAAHELKDGKTKSCGCLRKLGLAETYRIDLQGKIFGMLTAEYPTNKRTSKGSVIWQCRCKCGNSAEYSEDALVHGNTVSCGCKKEAIKSQIHNQLTFVDDTCIEWLKNRKHRSDNKSGFRGVHKNGNRWSATIGLQNKRYYLGRYDSYEQAVEARLDAEKLLHDGFVEAYIKWKTRATENESWAIENPFYYKVNRIDHEFFIDTNV